MQTLNPKTQNDTYLKGMQTLNPKTQSDTYIKGMHTLNPKAWNALALCLNYATRLARLLRRDEAMRGPAPWASACLLHAPRQTPRRGHAAQFTWVFWARPHSRAAPETRRGFARLLRRDEAMRGPAPWASAPETRRGSRGCLIATRFCAALRMQLKPALSIRRPPTPSLSTSSAVWIHSGPRCEEAPQSEYISSLSAMKLHSLNTFWASLRGSSTIWIHFYKNVFRLWSFYIKMPKMYSDCGACRNRSLFARKLHNLNTFLAKCIQIVELLYRESKNVFRLWSLS